VKRRDVLETIADAEDHYGSLVTGAGCSRRDVMRCLDAGLVQSAGLVVVCDDTNTPSEPERWREGFKLTQAGRLLLRATR
jgi:hypothetical protein